MSKTSKLLLAFFVSMYISTSSISYAHAIDLTLSSDNSNPAVGDIITISYTTSNLGDKKPNAYEFRTFYDSSVLKPVTSDLLENSIYSQGGFSQISPQNTDFSQVQTTPEHVFISLAFANSVQNTDVYAIEGHVMQGKFEVIGSGSSQITAFHEENQYKSIFSNIDDLSSLQTYDTVTPVTITVADEQNQGLSYSPADFNKDGYVDGIDYSVLYSFYSEPIPADDPATDAADESLVNICNDSHEHCADLGTADSANIDGRDYATFLGFWTLNDPLTCYLPAEYQSYCR